jgi:hypothetical protein
MLIMSVLHWSFIGEEDAGGGGVRRDRFVMMT